MTTIKVHTAAALVQNSDYVIAEDWPTLALASEAANMAARLLQPESAYAGAKHIRVIENYVAGLFDLDKDTPFGCTLHLATVTPDF